MADAPTWVQIVVAVIGSSLFGIWLTNLSIDYSQPSIDINVKRYDINATQIRFDTTISNRGNSKAEKLLITLQYPGGNIINYRTVFQTENSSSFMDSQHQSTLVTNLSRFAPSAVILIHTIVNDSKAPFFIDRDSTVYKGNYSHYTGSYIVSATYDQGGKQISSSEKPSMDAYQSVERVMPFSSVVSLWIGIATVIFASIIIYVAIIKMPRPNLDPGLAVIFAAADTVLVTLVLYLYDIVAHELLLFVTFVLASLIVVLGVVWNRHRKRKRKNHRQTTLNGS